MQALDENRSEGVVHGITQFANLIIATSKEDMMSMNNVAEACKQFNKVILCLYVLVSFKVSFSFLSTINNIYICYPLMLIFFESLNFKPLYRFTDISLFYRHTTHLSSKKDMRPASQYPVRTALFYIYLRVELRIGI